MRTAEAFGDIARVRPDSFYRRSGKRILDFALVLATSPLWAALVCLTALIVKLDGGPAFYTQLRVGQGGRIFKMWKLRSMVVGAEESLAWHLAADPKAKAEWAENQKLSRDPRITAVGRLIRKTSLDELPQLWNVLTGDMSLVGPRPIMVEQTPLYRGNAYYSMRPGVTGVWQVQARSKSTFADRVRYDEAYYQNQTLSGDLALICRTVVVVLAARGT
ncbi:sugar transferase [Gemmobacter straminiformis]|uniref:Sugar transferase n=2 Tax=Paragemmobacter straminiformis TaxID=2045119 RepID=A0A842I5L1_9RHOB|nr:sugar transferase [Gemmobacter straminiformis]